MPYPPAPTRQPRLRRSLALAVALGLALPALGPAGFEPAARAAQADDAAPATVADLVGGQAAQRGLVDVYANPAQGTVHLALPAPGADGVIGRYLYTARLARGLGSNPVGLDRAGAQTTHILRLSRIGDKVVAEAENPRYRATAGGMEARSVSGSFATSVLWAAPIAATRDDGALLVDARGLLVRDAVGIARRLAQAGQGRFSLDPERSFARADRVLVFPENIEAQALLTFTSDEPGAEVYQTAPDATQITLGVHHSLVALPAPGFRPRAWDPRTGSIAPLSYADYSAPLDAPLITRLARRHRLEKRDPAADRSPVKEPIVYYVDPATPEPVKSALIEGASWWAEAFEAAGFEDAYRVEVLPDDAHPLDIRYNMINWVHRQTRGWSYGGAVVDPRTGEIVKGNVMLGSLRVRQDRMIFEALLGAEASGRGGANDPVQVALARIRQLSAHEVGHTLGLAHNFAASTYGRASVMDYPAPKIAIAEDGTLDLSDAYGVGVGAWDKFAIRRLYAPVPPGRDEAAWLDDLAADAHAQGMVYVTDSNARTVDTAHPLASLWDNGPDPVRELAHLLQVRRIGLDGFGARALADGRDQSDLRRAFVPLYLFHRYQVAATAKVLGGRRFAYKTAGDDRPEVGMVSAARQHEALTALIRTLSPEVLAIDQRLAKAMTPRHGRSMDLPFEREVFASHAGEIFDRWSAVDVAAGLTLDAILHPARAARLIDQHVADADLPGLEQVFARLDAALIEPWDAPATDDDATKADAETDAIRNRVALRYVVALVDLARTGGPDVRAATEAQLVALRASLTDRAAAGAPTALAITRRIAQYLDAPAPTVPALTPIAAPPGSPIGQAPLPAAVSTALRAAAPGSGLAPDWPVYETCWHCGPAR
ncbi:uncharacterized protein DUF5117 [Rhodothalassium salexigens DSM 2132]|uniref:Uncharacterized protein DUF5117 n=2 Tax=Rhodothalassium salexigens TaxID=1086 RepID=A0A4R2PPC1_RHOSA|nr:uncharacterized protein DUF5117 [Rhodothalassium salexigens DSM 2132]